MIVVPEKGSTYPVQNFWSGWKISGRLDILSLMIDCSLSCIAVGMLLDLVVRMDRDYS